MLSPVADLRRHAAQTPDAIAIAGPYRVLTFAQLWQATTSIALRLQRAGVRPGDVVGVDLPTALEWVVDLALFRLAVRSVSLRGVRNPQALTLDALISEPGVRAARAPLVLEADDEWLVAGTGETGDDIHFDFDGPDAVFRYIFTSGTTGEPSAAAYSVGAFEYRLAEGHLHWTDGRPELTMIGLSTTGGFHAAAACMRYGIAYLAIDSIDPDTMRFAADRGIEVLCGSPTQVAHALQVMISADITLDHLREVRLAGAGPSARLLTAIGERLGVAVRGVYGSTEGGGISQLWITPETDRFDVGAALAGVELQVVDSAGAPVGPNVEGAVRYRTPGLVEGHVQQSRVVQLPDGWFVPGDRGKLTEHGSLVLAGRESELFNLGGVKIDPTRVDELAADFAGVRDAAAFSLERRPGIIEVGLAVVGGPECDLRALDRHLRQELPVGHPTAYWRVEVIARSRLGKVMRAALADDFERRPQA